MWLDGRVPGFSFHIAFDRFQKNFDILLEYLLIDRSIDWLVVYTELASFKKSESVLIWVENEIELIQL